MAAKPGNTNALKHGLYARNFTKDQRADLGKMPFNDLRQEIAALRVIVAQVMTVTQEAAPAPDADAETKAAYAKLVSSFATAITQLGQLARTQAILSGDDSPLNRAIDDALNGLDPYYTHDDTTTLPNL